MPRSSSRLRSAAPSSSAVGSPSPVGSGEVEVELEQRDEHEAPLGGLRVRQPQPLGGVLEVAEQQDVDVDRPGAVADAALEVAAQLALDRLAGVEQLLGAELGLDAQAGVEEARLV